jgi:hypothetical protein
MNTHDLSRALQGALGRKNRRLKTEALFDALVQRHPVLTHAPDRWERVVDLLLAAELEGLLVLPSRRGEGWNEHVVPARPLWVGLPTEDATGDTFDPRVFPWHPRLAFLAAVPCLPKGIREAALAIQRFWAAGGMNRPIVPIKERSYSIFGDEKRLDGLQHSEILFGPDRLTLTALQCYIVEPTPVAEHFPNGTSIIILENEATFDTFCRLARTRPSYGTVIYGRGHEIQKCTGYLRREATRLRVAEIAYFGDIDRRGLEIPWELQKSLPDLRLAPFIEGYAYLLRNDSPQQSPIPEICSWLPEELAALAANVLGGASRRPQEAFGWEAVLQIHRPDAS